MAAAAVLRPEHALGRCRRGSRVIGGVQDKRTLHVFSLRVIRFGRKYVAVFLARSSSISWIVTSRQTMCRNTEYRVIIGPILCLQGKKWHSTSTDNFNRENGDHAGQ